MTVREVERVAWGKLKGFGSLTLAFAWVVACLACLPCPPARAQDEQVVLDNPPSNEDFLRSSIRSLLESTFASFPAEESKSLMVRSEDEHPADWLLKDELVSYLTSLDREVVLQPAAGGPGSEESQSLFYRIIDMSLSYPQVKRKGFLGGRILTRRASLNLSFRLEDRTTGKVLWSERAKEEKSDLVKRSMAGSLNNKTYPFLSPSLPDDPQSRFMEPALVVAVVGGLVYLFFASR
jgi:hypothetical protein